MKALVWFRSDLRVEDNPALARAADEADDGLLAVFVATPEQWREHAWGDAKVDFLRRSLASLSERLEALSIPLLVVEAERFSDAPDALERIADQHSLGTLFFNCELEVNERRRDREVTQRWREAGRQVVACHDQTIVEPAAIRTGAGDVYSVYTPFRKAWIAHLEETGIPDPLAAPRRRDQAERQPDPIADTFGDYEPTPDIAELWPAGEEEAHRRLESFLDERGDDYDEARDQPAVDGTSSLSPYLALGVISARSCLAAAVAANRGELESGRGGIDTWIQEIVWREFYRHVLVGFPRVSKNRAFREETDAQVVWRDADSDLEAWKQGRTGYPFVDAGLRQLLETGWMHNRLRMVTAMFLTKHLLIDWRRGEEHFMNHLVDGDLASNNGGWQWSASTGTDAAPYFRVFNPWTQGRRFDPDGEFTRRYLPELADVDGSTLHDAKKMARLDLEQRDYPSPLVDHASARRRAIDAFKQ